jgi:metacaspase-1
MKRALCIGINNYPGVANDLKGCINDCDDWRSEFERRHFDDIRTLKDKDATKEVITNLLEDSVKITTPKDLLVVTYSGHGTWVPDTDGDESDGRDEALCPWDIGTTGAVITDDELYNIFSNRHRGARIVVLSDSCHSGSVTRFAPPVPGWSGHRKIRFLSPMAFKHQWSERALANASLSGLLVRKTRSDTLLISGCQDPEYSYDSVFNNRPNGAFTYVALMALKQLPEKATYKDWYAAIRKMLPSQSAPQTPRMDATSAQKKWVVFED